MKYKDFIENLKLDPKKFRSAWAFCIGNPWENEADKEALDNPELLALSDKLAQLVLDKVKTATASDFASYARENEPLPKADGTYDIVLNSKGEPVCAIQTTKTYVTKFMEVTDAHAFKEGEGDRTLAYWRKAHEAFFRASGNFSSEMEIYCEEFETL